MDFVGSGKYPWGGPWIYRSSYHWRTSFRFPPVAPSSAYRLWLRCLMVSFNCLVWSKSPIAYKIMANRHPCRMPGIFSRAKNRPTTKPLMVVQGTSSWHIHSTTFSTSYCRDLLAPPRPRVVVGARSCPCHLGQRHS